MSIGPASREQLLHRLYEAAELEHNLMCTYLYAAFSLKDGADGLSGAPAEATARWRRTILDIAVEEMGHVAAVWNITAALGGAPRFGRGNFPLDPGYLPAGVVVKLAPFGAAVLQHFIYLERPEGSEEPDGDGFEPPVHYRRGIAAPRLTPMGLDYETVGAFYAALGRDLQDFVARLDEGTAFCGDPALQLSPDEVDLAGARPVICLKTALAAFDAIVRQGEGAQLDSEGSHYRMFVAIRAECAALTKADPAFIPAFPAAVNPVLRRPPRPEGRVWIDNEEAARTVDLANAAYGLMLRLVAYSFAVPRPAPEKALAIDLAIGLMQAMTLFAERAARLPAGPSHPECHAGMSFVALRDSAPLPPGRAARRFFIERLGELADAAAAFDGDKRTARAARLLGDLAARGRRGFEAADAAPVAHAPPTAPAAAPASTTVGDVEECEGANLTLLFEAKKCIHSRYCVTWGPAVFRANVEGPWIHPDAMDVERVAEIAHACPSGAIRYRRKDGRPEEAAPPVNLIAVREAGPYAVRADIRLNGEGGMYRATLCRCGASKNKPFCDGSHNDIGFAATGEPASRKTDMLAVRDGPLAIDPETDGPLRIRGNLEITSGTGRVVARLTQARLCRCGASSTKPFCDGSHAKIGFRSGAP
ncbi:MAG: CDGSH iron-sulfur domain-containing protein [Alphaproteobacteria bacterium]|nr:CDGSH iron-sulfur domain-containing protein [Alphaproteobacteria bacterium]